MVVGNSVSAGPRLASDHVRLHLASSTSGRISLILRLVRLMPFVIQLCAGNHHSQFKVVFGSCKFADQ